jgi:aminopeptidase N
LLPRVDLSFDLESPDRASVHSRLYFSRQEHAESADLVLDGDADIDLQSIYVGEIKSNGLSFGRSLAPSTDYVLSDDKLTIHSDALPDASEFTIDTHVEISPKKNLSFAGLYMDGGGSFITQCEAHGFRRITYSLDRPDVLSEYLVSLTADKGACPVLLSNGNLVHSEEHEDGRHTTLWHDPHLKPSYLFALVAGDLGHVHGQFRTMSGKDVDLYIYSEKKNVGELDFAMFSLKQSMKWDEEKYGREYDLDRFNIVATDSFNMGAMENKSLNVFNTAYVLGHKDMSSDGELTNILRVIGHEYFHNWTGNRITCRDWFQLTLKEGLTVFRDQQFTADETSHASKRIDEVAILRAVQFAEDAGSMAHPIRPESVKVQDNFYTPTVYNKGAEVIRMFHTLLGPSLFRKGMDLYFDKHDGEAVTCDDFRMAMAAAAREGGGEHGAYLSALLTGQFELWYSQDGTPTIRVERRQDGEDLTLTFTQSCAPSRGQPRKLPYCIPVKLGVLDPQTGADIVLAPSARTTTPLLHGDTLVLTEATETITFQGIPSNAVLSVMRGLSAPVRVDIPSQTVDDLAFMCKADGDSLNRYDAAQRFGKRVVFDVMDGNEGNLKMLVSCYRELLDDPGVDPALKAASLVLPSFQDLKGDLVSAGSIPIDPDSILNARKQVRLEIARELKDSLLRQYKACRGECKSYEFSPHQVANRRLAHVCLRYLTHLVGQNVGGAEAVLAEQVVVGLCTSLFRNADNMTDQAVGMGCLSDLAVPEREQALESFHRQWNQNSLVMDRWFWVQSASSLPNGIERVQALMKHECFQFTNPNKLRSVVGAFCSGNVEQFHAKDGSGYRFLGGVIRQIDPLNPQMGAALAKLFLDWTVYDPMRRGVIKEELTSILHNDGASDNVKEVCEAALAAEHVSASL